LIAGQLPESERACCLISERYADDARRCMHLAYGDNVPAWQKTVWLVTSADLFEQAAHATHYPEVKENYLLLAHALLLESGVTVTRH